MTRRAETLASRVDRHFPAHHTGLVELLRADPRAGSGAAAAELITLDGGEAAADTCIIERFVHVRE